MESLNTMHEIKREWEILSSPSEVCVCVRVKWINGVCLPDDDGDEIKSARFRIMTLEDNELIGKLSLRKDSNENKMDREEMKCLMIRRLLLDWDLDIPIQYDGDWMTKECFNRVMRLPAPLLSAFLDKYENEIRISEEEEREIQKQSIVLFSPNSGGIKDACEAVTLFCNLGNFWEKFGLNKWDMKNLTYREFMLLRLMIGHEMEKHKKQNTPAKKRPTKIAGRSGTRPSRGIVVQNSG